ncbi:type III-B CRISPR module-associated protein Cmr5 [Caldivirga maquilingensis]|uniref:CRISPR type III-B/RAMP module-associated protein Cmr5 n=1 Tax=Caldivirga maquilingensis (strain ATCC 700844 / DSM 13496 / JCM 10307 / IC-167) TaxID=397948 RepID=A8M9C1_CALMQ|nr:type III-B CRISPR module-associated protein Cmr5 [Caldivirga maquilingensis]ABW02340.1 CRISPR-associated protein, Cmr5 family [Caldivirga maquilingensis IC-167]
MSEQVRDKALDLAITCINAVKNLNNNDILKGFRTRCRRELEGIYYNGLTYELAFILAKSSDKNGSGYGKLNNVLNEKDIGKYLSNIKNKISDEAYEVYGACLLWAMRELGLIDGAKDLMDLLNKLNTLGTEVIVTNKILTFADWLKRLAEAMISEVTQ